MAKKLKEAEHDLGYYRDLAQNIIRLDSGKLELFNEIDRADKMLWELPKTMNMDWVHKFVVSDIRDAIRTGTRTLSGTKPNIKVRPWADNIESRKYANELERILAVLLKQASKRNQVPIQRDAVKSALKYDMVCAQVIYIPYQKKIAKAYGLGSASWDKIDGDFVVKFRDPRSVSVVTSDYGQEGVLYHYKSRLDKIINFWGREKFGEHTAQELMIEYEVYDYTDKVNRVVWVEGLSTDRDRLGTEIMRCKHELPFIPWVAKSGGSNIDDDSKYMYEPLISSSILGKQWDSQNIAETLFISDIIARAAQPRGKKSGPNPEEGVVKDYMEPGGDVLVTTGHDYQVLPPEPIDQGMMAVADRISNMVNKSSVPRVLQDAQSSANESFGGFNSRISLASAVLKPHKELAEMALAEILTTMVRWISYDGESISVYGDGRSIGEMQTDLGYEYILDPDTIDLKTLDIEVELRADLPTDRQQQINAAIGLVNSLDYSMDSALEDIGVSDPALERTKSTFNKLEKAIIDAEIAKIQGKAQAEVQAMIMQVQMQAQMAQQQAVQEQQANSQVPTDMNSNMQGANSGDINNPGEGGLPPQWSNPNQTFEGQTGMTRGGEDIQNVG